MSTHDQIYPVSVKRRIIALDVLRGFALFGILMVNMPLMYEPISKLMLGTVPDQSFTEAAAHGLIKFLFEGKFYVIFSMLFGYGFWMFLNKEPVEGRSVTALYRRRIFILMIFGLIHIVFLWAGDILFFYALFGFILIWFRNASDKKIKRWIIGLLLLPLAMNTAFFVMVQAFSGIPEAQSAIDTSFQESVNHFSELVARARETYANGSFAEITSIRIEEYTNLFFGSLFFFCPVILAMFLLGFLAARKGLISNYHAHLPLIKSIFKWGLLIGLLSNALYVYASQKANMLIPDAWSPLSASMHTVGGVSLGLFYISAILRLLHSNKLNWMQKHLAPTGRMALTNYLTQSVLAVVLFHAWGFGWYGQIDVWNGIALTIVIFVVQMLLSRWWLQKFRFGPAEWLWRRLTYGKLNL